MSIKVMNLVLDSSIPGTSKRFTLLALADRASDQGEITAYGVETLCSKTDIARSTMFGILKELEADALIQRVERNNGDGSRSYSRFWLNIPLLRSLRRPDADKRSMDEPTNPFAITAAQTPVQILDSTPITHRPDSGPPARPDSGPSHRPDSGPPARPDSGPLNPNPKSDTNERSPLPEPTEQDRAVAWSIAKAVDLKPVDPKPTQVRQIRDVVAAALAAGYPEDQVQAYLALKVSEGRVVKYVLGAFAPHRLVDIPAALLAAGHQLPPICGQCDARPGDPVAARVVWHADNKPVFCPRCHPKGITGAA